MLVKMTYCNAIVLACAAMAIAGPLAPRQDDINEDVPVCNKFGLDVDQCSKVTTECLSEARPSDPTKQVDFGDLEGCVGRKSKAAKNEGAATKKPSGSEKKPKGFEKKPTGVDKKTATKDKSAARN